MAFEVPGPAYSLPAGSDLSSSQFLAMKSDAAGGADTAGAGELAIGVLQNKPSLGQGASLVDRGITKMVAGAALAEGARLSADAAGKAVTAGGGDYLLGTALSAAGAADEIVSVRLHLSGAKE